jgi:hypothetical protein
VAPDNFHAVDLVGALADEADSDTGHGQPVSFAAWQSSRIHANNAVLFPCAGRFPPAAAAPTSTAANTKRIPIR